MSTEAANAFLDELTGLVNRFRHEWKLNYAECIGALEVAKHDILEEMRDLQDEDDEDSE